MTGHAAARLAERYGITEPGAVDRIAAAIQADESVLMRTGHDGAERHMVQLDGRVIVAVWNPGTGAVLTVLAPDNVGASTAQRVRRRRNARLRTRRKP